MAGDGQQMVEGAEPVFEPEDRLKEIYDNLNEYVNVFLGSINDSYIADPHSCPGSQAS